MAAPASDASRGGGYDPAALGLEWVLPFAGLLLSIALLPLLAPRLWHRRYGTVAAFWALTFVAPFAAAFGVASAARAVFHTLVLDYLPFVILLLALYTVTGGIRVTGTLRGTPAVNTLLLAIGTAAAGVMGTTGAAMLLVRPLIRANRDRPRNRHVFVFFIFLVANLGGALTPLGDPPLFIGFMEGVPFSWPAVHLGAPMALATGILLAAFYALDSWHHRRHAAPDPSPADGIEKLGLEGKMNFLLLAVIVGIVMLSGVWEIEGEFAVYDVEVEPTKLVASTLLLGVIALSLRLTRRELHERNEFGWGAMIEVAILFAAIFLTIVPALAIAQAGSEGAACGLVALLSHDGQPRDRMYFWLTGLLSAFLDNAPTYLLFFNFAGGDPAVLTGPLAGTLRAISAGAVFFGALTYIGNAPNLMVKAVAEGNGLRMPGFFGYMVWSSGILLPLFALVTVVFF